MKHLLGPELYWLAAYLIMRWLGSRNVPATAPGNTMLEYAVWVYAFGVTAASFLCYLVPAVHPWWLLLRLGIAAFIGLNFCTLHAADSIHYPEPGRDSGLYGYWLMGTLGGLAVYAAGAISAAAVLWQARPR